MVGGCPEEELGCGEYSSSMEGLGVAERCRWRCTQMARQGSTNGSARGKWDTDLKKAQVGRRKGEAELGKARASKHGRGGELVEEQTELMRKQGSSIQKPLT